ncbi:MAG: ATP-binding protein [Gammaproteobacteria bacterium]
MNITQLKQLIREGESQHVEFKKSTAQIKAAFTTVCAFLNDTGGIVVFGAKDNGELIGQQIADKTKLEIAHEIKKIEPNAHITVHYIPIENNRHMIVLEVPQGKHIPYVYEARPYERTQSSTAPMTQHRYEQLIVQRAYLNHNWVEFHTNEYSIDHLDHDEIKNTVAEGIQHNRISPETINYSIEQILINFNLIQNNALTNAAVVLFCKSTKKIFSRCEFKMARFRGLDKIDGFIDNQMETGNTFQLIQLAHHFANRHLPIAGFFEPGKLARIDQPAVPQLALREALINAFCHRNYNERSASPHLAIYDDRLEIWNPGALPPGITLEQLKKPHHSFPRNELIANVFYKRGWIEKWGTGTTRMVEFCKKNNTPEPTFSEEFHGFSVVFSFKEAMNSGITINSSTAIHQLTSRQQEILNLLNKSEAMSANNIIDKLEMPPAPRTLRDDLMCLKKNGLIDSKGHAKKTIWFKIKPT